MRGNWKPIITQGEHDTLKAVLRRPDKRARVPRRGARHYLLTGILRCGVCTAPMYGNRQGAEYYAYTCSGRGHVNTVSGPSVDEHVEARILNRIGNATFEVKPAEFAGDARIGEIGAQITELMTAYNARQLSAAVAFGAVEALENERADLEEQRANLAAAVPLQRLTALTVADWVGWDVDRRRAAAESLIEAVMIRPKAKLTGNKFDAARIDLVWKA